MHDTDAQDELGTVTRAFNTMVENLDLYMARTKASMEKEQQMMERELLMENHLKRSTAEISSVTDQSALSV